jgi:hypothetical protein
MKRAHLAGLLSLLSAACASKATPSSGPSDASSAPDASSTSAGDSSTAPDASSAAPDASSAAPDGSGTGVAIQDGGSGEAAAILDGAASSPLGATVGDFVGVDGFVGDPTDWLAAIGNVREYHDWQLSEGNGDTTYPGYPNNQNSFSLFNGFWDWDTYFGGLKAKGVFGYPAIQGGVPWLNGGAVPPVPEDASVTDPASYAAHADEMFQYAARYGSTKVADNLLKLASGQTRSSGLGFLQYIEDWNEEDAWWVLPSGQPVFAPDVYAAMASADCDGDQGRLGKTLGMKQADPAMKCVMGGLAGKGTPNTAWEADIEQYLDGVRAWAAAHRGGAFPADVINVHYYSFGPDPAGTPNPRPAVSPEDDHVTSVMAKLRAYRDANLPGKELWLTEFGYDTDPQSILHAPALGGQSADIVQGQWIVRYYLSLMAAGFDRAFLYVSHDGCSGADASCPTQFDTSGLTVGPGQTDLKPAYYFIATFRSRLSPFAWAGQVASGNPNVTIHKLKDPQSTKGAYVVWAPTSSGMVVPGFALPIGPATTATSVVLTDKSLTGTESTLVPAGGAVTLDVTETPTIVLVDSMP